MSQRALPLRHARTLARPILIAFALASCASLGKRAAAPAAASLYARLGGYDALTAVTDDFLARVLADVRIEPFFRGLETKDMQRTRQHLVDLLCAATGGPCFYPGRDMKTAHAQFEISPDVWNAFTGHLNETVARFRIGDRERNDLVAIVQSLRSEIVNRP